MWATMLLRSGMRRGWLGWALCFVSCGLWEGGCAVVDKESDRKGRWKRLRGGDGFCAVLLPGSYMLLAVDLHNSDWWKSGTHSALLDRRFSTSIVD